MRAECLKKLAEVAEAERAAAATPAASAPKRGAFLRSMMKLGAANALRPPDATAGASHSRGARRAPATTR